MNFWTNFKFIIENVLKLMNTPIIIGGFSFSFLAVFIGSTILSIIFWAVGRMFK